jgi:hypothetical protein
MNKRLKYYQCIYFTFMKVLSLMDIMETIREQIEGNPIILYMKGSPNSPQCGFSARTIEALTSCG